ncbi:hypothetical protein CAPTEDRAFT_206729 [Capitella teleta]|uniref:Uncharacterized protein n=1 Tax=Capitella teleta TaxID=283909 RepID=R7TVE4_CAPTE|nr:hypothetical protein CAPTEDRAFT_206729 [Capitella teleta]|eukprot:ELT97694.1 hypothetical protein CAPTEDRAFT_206729 [Capitella teleta]
MCPILFHGYRDHFKFIESHGSHAITFGWLLRRLKGESDAGASRKEWHGTNEKSYPSGSKLTEIHHRLYYPISTVAPGSAEQVTTDSSDQGKFEIGFMGINGSKPHK